MQWRYRGKVAATGGAQIGSEVRFTNTSIVLGEETIAGENLTVFRDTNAGNTGPSVSYYRREMSGIFYHGSKPGTRLERQVVPYQLLRLPIQVPDSFQQFDLKGLDFGSDLDGDGVNEQTDLEATISVVGVEEVTVPAGTYEALRIEARMTIGIHLTKTNQVAVGDDTVTTWFSRGVGVIKYTERQQIQDIRTGAVSISVITEELEGVKYQVPLPS